MISATTHPPPRKAAAQQAILIILVAKSTITGFEVARLLTFLLQQTIQTGQRLPHKNHIMEILRHPAMLYHSAVKKRD